MSMLDVRCLSARFSHEASDHLCSDVLRVRASVIYSVQCDLKLPFYQSRQCAFAAPNPEPQQLDKTTHVEHYHLLFKDPLVVGFFAILLRDSLILGFCTHPGPFGRT